MGPLRGREARAVYLGDLGERHLRVGETDMAMFELNPRATRQDGQSVAVHVEPRDIVLLPVDQDDAQGAS